MQEIQEQSLRWGHSDDVFEHTVKYIITCLAEILESLTKKIAMGSRHNKDKQISTPGKMKGYSGKEPWSCFTVWFSSEKHLFKSLY